MNRDKTGWRYRCPKGHVNVGGRVFKPDGETAKAKYYCRSCQDNGENPHYDRLIDAKTGEPV
jgi:predicted small secreted protein